MSDVPGAVPAMNKRFAAAANLFFSSSHALFTIVTGLVMVPVYLNHFPLSVYGAWLASGNIVSMIAMIEPGISTIATQRLADSYASGEKERFSEIFGSAMLLTACFSVGVMLLGLGFSFFIPSWINAPKDACRSLTAALQFSSIGAGSSFLFYSLGAAPQAWQRTVAPGVIGVVALTVNVCAILIGLYFGLGVTALGIGAMCFSLSYALGYSIYVAVIWRRMNFSRPSVSLRIMMEILNASKILFLAKIAGTIGKYLEAPAAALVVSTEAAAVLVLTGRVLTAIQMFADRVGTAVFAGLSHVAAKARGSGDYTVVREVLVISTIISGLGIGFSLAMSQSIISVWVGEGAFGGFQLLLLLAVATFISSRKELISSLLVAMGEINSAANWLIVEAILRVGLITIFALSFKVPGIPLAAATAAFITLLGLCRVMMHRFALKAEMLYSPGAKGFVISIVLGSAAVYLAPAMRNWTQLIVGSVSCLTLLIAASLFDREWVDVLLRTLKAVRSGVALRRQPI